MYNLLIVRAKLFHLTAAEIVYQFTGQWRSSEAKLSAWRINFLIFWLNLQLHWARRNDKFNFFHPSHACPFLTYHVSSNSWGGPLTWKEKKNGKKFASLKPKAPCTLSTMATFQLENNVYLLTINIRYYVCTSAGMLHSLAPHSTSTCSKLSTREWAECRVCVVVEWWRRKQQRFFRSFTAPFTPTSNVESWAERINGNPSWRHHII